MVGVQEPIKAWAAANGVAGDYQAICKDAKTNKYLLDEINRTGKEGKLKVPSCSQGVSSVRRMLTHIPWEVPEGQC